MKGWLCAFCLAAALGAALWLRPPRLSQDVTRILPADDPELSGLLWVGEHFGRLDTFAIDVGFDPARGGSQALAIAAADSLAARLRASGQFARAEASIIPPESLARFESLAVKFPYWTRPEQLDAWAAALTREELARRLAAARRALIGPSGPIVKQGIRRDPLGLGEEVLRGLAPGEDSAKIVAGRLFSPQGRDLLMLAVPGFPAADLDRGRPLLAAAESARAAVEARFGPGIAIHYAGGHIAHADNARTIRADIERSLLGVSVALLVLGLLFFRRRRALFLLFLPAAFGSAFSLWLCGLFYEELSSIAIGCGSALIGIAVDYGIHVLFHREGGASLRDLRAPLALGAATTCAGLLCLALSPIPGQQQMGLFAACGVIAAAGFAWFLLPRLAGPAEELEPGLGARLCARVLAWRRRSGKLLGLALVCLLGLAGWGWTRLRLEGDVTKLSHLGPRNAADNAHLLGVWGSFASSSAVVGGDSLEAALRASETLAVALEELAAEGRLGNVRDLHRVLPSRARQRAAWKSFAEFWEAGPGVRILADLRAEASAAGFSERAFAPFFEALRTAPPEVSPDDFAGSIFATLLEQHLTTVDGRWHVLSSFQARDRARLPALRERLRAAVPEVLVVDKRAFVEATTALVQRWLFVLAGYACLAVGLCLWLAHRRLELVLLTLLPVLLSGAIGLGLLGAVGVPLNLMGCLFVVFVFGVGVDFAVFLVGAELVRYRGGEASGRTWGSVCFCALTTLCGFAGLALARHPALFNIGLTGFFGIAASLLTALWIVPGLGGFLLPRPSRGAPALVNLLNALPCYLWLAGVMLAWALLVRPATFLFRYAPARRRALCRRYSAAAVRWMVRLYPLRNVVQTQGLDPESFRAPAVIACNHQSMFDVMLVQILPAPLVQVVKRWVWGLPLMGRMVRDAGGILLEPEGAEEFLAAGTATLEEGVSVLVFPEGTRSLDGRLRRFRKGAFELALRTGADVLPVLVVNTISGIPRDSFWTGQLSCGLVSLPRIPAAAFAEAGAKAFADETRARLLAAEPAAWRAIMEAGGLVEALRVRYRYRGSLSRGWRQRLRALAPEQLDAALADDGRVLQLGLADGLLPAALALYALARRVRIVPGPDGPEEANVRAALFGLRGLSWAEEPGADDAELLILRAPGPWRAWLAAAALPPTVWLFPACAELADVLTGKGLTEAAPIGPARIFLAPGPPA